MNKGIVASQLADPHNRAIHCITQNKVTIVVLKYVMSPCFHVGKQLTVIITHLKLLYPSRGVTGNFNGYNYYYYFARFYSCCDCNVLTVDLS